MIAVEVFKLVRRLRTWISIGPQQRTLEEIVLSVTGTGSDQVS